jgi:4-alpha-glucanotransferase
VRLPRSSGLLLHPTSLPGRYGIGEIGAEARRFVDFLAAAGQSTWQTLPLGPTGFGDSPYQCFSAFAGNPLLVSLDGLVEDGLLARSDLEARPHFPEGVVAYGDVIPWKRSLLERAAERFRSAPPRAIETAFAAFCDEHAVWLDDDALFMAVKDAHGGAVWNEWEPELMRREPGALRSWRERLEPGIHSHRFMQFAFFRQWRALRAHARERGIRLIGDVPIFAAFDSADAWAHRELFFLDDRGRPTVIAGVPPDYFSKTGQRWGNPLYRWEVMARDGFRWWIERLRALFEQCDIVRLDHFIGFTRYWEIPAEEETAVKGRWVPGPGEALFHAVERALGDAPIIAEDLGVVTPAVEAMRDQFEFPGMKIVIMADWRDPRSSFLPHNFTRNYVAYTSTHDSETAAGWLASASGAERARAIRYAGGAPDRFPQGLIRCVMASVADTVVVPVQDVLGLGSEGRMNFPGRLGGNWTWRLPAGALDGGHRDFLAELADLYGRRPASKPGTAAATRDPATSG